jgi:hypothetical protein
MRFEGRDVAAHHRKSFDTRENALRCRGRQVAIHHELDDRRTRCEYVVEVRQAMIVPALQRLDDRGAVWPGSQCIGFEQAVDGDGIAPVPAVEAPIEHSVGDAPQRGDRG